MDDPAMPDLSHLSQEEREIIENVLKRQREEEVKETQISQKADEELDQIDRQINERKESARRLVGTQDDAICQICQKTKFADGIGHKCFYCQLRSCARCGGRSQSKNKAIWACSLCQKRQQILAKTGKWFQQEVPPKPSSPCTQQPSTSEVPSPTQPQIICPPSDNISPRISNGPQAPAPMQQQPMNTQQQQYQEHHHQERSSVIATNGPGPRRQNTLQRQPTMEQKQQQQHIQHPQPNGRDKRIENVRMDSRQRIHEGDIREEHSRSRQDENRPLFTVNSNDDNGYPQQQPVQRERMDNRMPSKTPAPVPPAAVPPTPPTTTTTPRPPEFRRTRSIREDEGRRGSIGVRLDNTGTISTGGQSRVKKDKRLHRQLRSMSSSDEDVPSTSEGFPGEEARQRLPNECTSERDLLRYIYSGEKIRNGRKSGMNKPFFGSVEPGGGRPSPVATGVPPAVIPGEHLAAKIRTYLSHPVTWQPSADQRRLIGHMVLSRNDGSANGDLGLKVVGGRRSDTGRLGAFITRVKPGSVADTVGRLRPGDEVLEWNGTPLQNATFDQVYEVISASKHESQIDLIVSRSAWIPGGDDFLQIQSAMGPIQSHIRHLPNPQFVQDFTDAEFYGAASNSPLPHSQSAFLSSPRMSYYQTETLNFGARGTIFGRIELALHYSHHDKQLTVTIEKAFDLAPRPDGVLRNPFVKIFLLPDRSELSRRQTAVLAETLAPIWGERFYYNQLTEPLLFERALEVTVWDYDKLDSNAFLGEVLVDFSAVHLDGSPMIYTLVDMDDENPLRTRLRQRKLSQYTSMPSRMRDDPPRPHSEMAYHGYRRAPERTHNHHHHHNHSREAAYDEYETPMRRSRTYDRYGAGAMVPTPTMPEEDWSTNQQSGYLSDHAHSQPSRYRHRRPRSATAMRHMTAAEMGASRMYSRAPVDDWEDAPTPESTRGLPVAHLRDPRSPNGRVLMETMHEQQGYGSDGSETLSIHSQQSMPYKTINRRPQLAAPVEASSGEVEEYLPEETGTSSKSVQSMKERKKSLMTRFIPGRAGEAAAKRTGFARSEEVGIPENLSADRLPAMLKQTSKESTDSGDKLQLDARAAGRPPGRVRR